MGLPLPSENFRGYQKSSLIDQIQYIEGKEYFLAHGMADRNVHIQNSMIIAKVLVNHNIPFEQHVSVLFQGCQLWRHLMIIFKRSWRARALLNNGLFWFHFFIRRFPSLFFLPFGHFSHFV